jgi:hypothetical protein
MAGISDYNREQKKRQGRISRIRNLQQKLGHNIDSLHFLDCMYTPQIKKLEKDLKEMLKRLTE